MTTNRRRVCRQALEKSCAKPEKRPASEPRPCQTTSSAQAAPRFSFLATPLQRISACFATHNTQLRVDDFTPASTLVKGANYELLGKVVDDCLQDMRELPACVEVAADDASQKKVSLRSWNPRVEECSPKHLCSSIARNFARIRGSSSIRASHNSESLCGRLRFSRKRT